MLTTLLAAMIREVPVVWSTSVDDGLVDRVKPDLVLTEMAERLLHQTVEDDFAVSVYAREVRRRSVRGVAARVAGHASAVTAGRRRSREASPHGQGAGLTRPAAFDRRR
ncbi:hypothetical protein R1A27_03980 [Methylobacterium sp. NMS12]|uniref:hypothetical protein n=1 Tax=Methylobacterium sp. NMS12 TaxID=3079766 RepID=UPI003F884491